jgi:hypothetical protein
MAIGVITFAIFGVLLVNAVVLAVAIAYAGTSLTETTISTLVLYASANAALNSVWPPVA